MHEKRETNVNKRYKARNMVRCATAFTLAKSNEKIMRDIRISSIITRG